MSRYNGPRTMPTTDSALILFTLAPRAERARKGLGAGVIESLLEAVRAVAASLDGVDLFVASPEGELDATGRLHHLRQRGRDFGESLRFAVEDVFASGYRRVVVIGNDAPEISKGYLQEAFASLASPKLAAVLGPAEDGGYNLLGLNAPCREAFEGVSWGTSRVAVTTESKLSGSGFLVRRLATLADIDDATGLVRFVRRVRASFALAPRLLIRLARRLAGLASPSRWLTVAAESIPRAAFTGSVQLRAPPF
jgi:glycosyltransferase A (GT-A) superfamily protein (DUF2064 family)